MKGRTLELLCAQVEDRLLALDIMGIQEILRAPTVVPVPRAPERVAGVFNLRGVLIPVVDLHRAVLGGGPRSCPGDPKLVVVRAGGRTAGLLVDRVHEVVSVSLNELSPVPAVGDDLGGTLAAAFRREFEEAGSPVVLLLRLGPLLEGLAAPEGVQ